MIDPRQRRLLVLCLTTVYLVWGTSYLANRIGVQHLPPMLFAGLRYFISGLLLMTVAFRRGFSLQQVAGHWRDILVMSLLTIAICNGMQVWAMQWVPSHTGALLNTTSASWIVIFGLFGARSHRPDARAITGLVIGLLGTVLLIWSRGDSGSANAVAATPLLPQLVILLACIVWSLGTIYMRNAAMTLDLFALVGLQMLIGGLVLTSIGLISGETHAWNWAPAGIISLVYLLVFSSCIAHIAYAWLARHATPAQVGTYSYVNPAVAAVGGYLVLDERFSPQQLAGALVILAGVLLINWPAKGPIAETEPAI